MRLLIEVDGVILDVQPAFWAAYRGAVARVGLAPADARTFWRLIRTGASDEQLLERARPHQVKQMRAELDQRLESAEVAGTMILHEGAADALGRLVGRFEVQAITRFANTGALLAALRPTAAARYFELIDRIDAQAEAAARTIRALVDARPPAAVLCASALMARAASEAEAINIGIASGACIGKRLAKWGTAAMYPDLPAFADAVDRGESELVRAGLLLA
jgi:phosphoglycolate phosphatase-like HAD superfamily hydrolase